MSDQITPEDISRLAANESIISAVLKWAAANGRRLNKADLERMGQGVDAMVEENQRLTKERDEANEINRLLREQIRVADEAFNHLTKAHQEAGNAAFATAVELVNQRNTALNHIKRLEEFVNRFLHPEDLGFTVTAWIRDDARESLGMPKVETKAKEAKL